MTILQNFLSGSSFNVDSADFDGANDYMARGAALTGAANSKLVTFSVWIRVDGGDGTARKIIGSANAAVASIKWAVEFTTGNLIRFFGIRAGSDTSTLSVDSNTAYTAGASWIHVMASFDMSDTAKRFIYVNDASDIGTVNSYADVAIGFAEPAEWAIGSDGQTLGNNKWDGCLAELYFAPGQYLDLSVESNRRKFITASLRPVYLGTDGSAPTGTAPIVYSHLGAAEAVANFATNRGTGGNFSITGTLTTGSTSPSD